MNDISTDIFKEDDYNKYDFIFLSLSNFSLITIKSLLIKYGIENFTIILSCQDSNSKSEPRIMSSLIKKLNIPTNRIKFIDSDLNYNYLKFIKKKSNLINYLLKFKKNKKNIFISSINYGLVFNLIKLKLRQKKDLLIDEGITNWIDIHDRNIFIKNIIYALIFKKIGLISKQRYKNVFIKIGLFNYPKLPNQNFVSINKNFKFLLKKNRINLLTNKRKKNILLILAKNFHYKNGIDNFIKDFENYIKKKFKGDFNLFLKPHPGFPLIKQNNVITNSIFPIEFYNLEKFEFIFSPINTSAILIYKMNLFSKKNLYSYNVNQDNLEKKRDLADKIKIKKINLL